MVSNVIDAPEEEETGLFALSNPRSAPKLITMIQANARNGGCDDDGSDEMCLVGLLASRRNSDARARVKQLDQREIAVALEIELLLSGLLTEVINHQGSHRCAMIKRAT